MRLRAVTFSTRRILTKGKIDDFMPSLSEISCSCWSSEEDEVNYGQDRLTGLLNWAGKKIDWMKPIHGVSMDEKWIMDSVTWSEKESECSGNDECYWPTDIFLVEGIITANHGCQWTIKNLEWQHELDFVWYFLEGNLREHNMHDHGWHDHEVGDPKKAPDNFVPTRDCEVAGN